MKLHVNEILALMEQGEFSSALALCESAVSRAMTSFMEELTVNTATDYIASVCLYAQICSQIKKPWKAFPKLEAAAGGLRFLNDYMSDTETLADTYLAVADSYAYGTYFPEAVRLYRRAALLSEDKNKGKEALLSALFYEKRFGKCVDGDLAQLKGKFGEALYESARKQAEREAEGGILTDPVENSEAFVAIRYELEEKVDLVLSSFDSNDLPFCIRYWNTKKEILKDSYAIEWKSPAEMNPHIRFY